MDSWWSDNGPITCLRYCFLNFLQTTQSNPTYLNNCLAPRILTYCRLSLKVLSIPLWLKTL